MDNCLLKIAKNIASCLSTLSEDDKIALRTWARNASLEKWREDPIVRIKGVGLITFQYLRMMEGINTVMPDKIVKRVTVPYHLLNLMISHRQDKF